MTTLITEVYDAFKDAGASEDKARKAAEAMLTALQSQSATKADIAVLQGKMIEIEGRIIKWVIGMAFAQFGAMAAIIKLFMH